MATQKKHSIEELRLSRGGTVLDAGCGTGEEVVAIAKEVGNTGRCVGMEARAPSPAKYTSVTLTVVCPSASFTAK